MKHVLIFVIIFLIIYLTYLFFIILRKNKLEKFKKNTYVNYLVKVNKLDYKKTSIKLLANVVAITNAFIIALTFIAISYINNLFVMMILAFLILIPLQFFMYSIIGYFLRRREEKCTITKK